MEDRRQMRRFTLKLPCLIYDWNDACDALLFEARTINVSIGGALIETGHQLPVGMPIQLNLLIRRYVNAEPVDTGSCASLSGRTVRTDDAGLGIAFSDAYRIMRTSHLFGRYSAVSQWLQKMKVNGKVLNICDP